MHFVLSNPKSYPHLWKKEREMKMFKDVLPPGDYLGEKCKETDSGRITFSTTVIRNFCDTYTNIDYDMLSTVHKSLLKAKMIQIASAHGFPFQGKKVWNGIKLDINLS